jgi:hypothetical protein
MASNLICGLDLGTVQDYSALSVLERLPAPVPTPKRRYQYRLRWLETWDLGTKYTDIVAGVAARFDTPALRWSKLAIDMTGVGVAVVDLVRAAKVQARVTPVVITGGHKTTVDPETRESHVPKKELVSTLMVLLQAGLVKWDVKALKLAARLEKELAEFRVKVTKSANETFGGDKSSHDDLVLSLALACWLGEHSGGGDPAGISVPDEGAGGGRGGSVVGDAPGGVFHE